MKRRALGTAVVVCLGGAHLSALARPYAGISGLAASADSAMTAGTNPAGIVRLDRASRLELAVLHSESEWEGTVQDGSLAITSDDSTTLAVPQGYMVRPISDDFSFSFTLLGFGVADDFGDWPGRYFIESYESASVSLYPSLAYRINDVWSVAGSAMINYARFAQERAVANFLDPGFEDGTSELEADGWDLGFGVSTLYQLSDRTRLGLVYNSELDPTQDGDAKFRGIGPNTRAALEAAGFYDADVEVKATTPQSVLAGVYHEFENNHALVLDLAWSDFSNYELSEYYFDGDQLKAHEATWQDIYAVSGSYSWPLNERWMLSAGGMYVSSMVEDDDRIFMLRMDEIWSAGFAAEWQWTDDRTLDINLSYMTIGDAPIESPSAPGIGAVAGEYNSRDIFVLRIGVSWGSI